MISLHYFSNAVHVRLGTIAEVEDEEYSLDQIKEFEEVDPLWQEALTALLQGIVVVIRKLCPNHYQYAQKSFYELGNQF